ncbi:MAG: DUF3801 domain-containing protein [Ruminococcus sp.]|nr:DUF3801 domain-containing protein [Ruminococcus sp.]
MHGDDVASAGVSVSTQIVSKATEILMDLLKLAIEREREAARLKQSENQETVLSGGEVTYQKLKEGGEVTMLPSFAKDDYGEFLKRAKEMDIPVAAIQEHGKENTLSLFFNVKDKEAVNAIVQDIVREKLKQPEQTERMITIEKEQVEGFQMYCSDHDIPVNFMETQNGVKCIFGAAYEKQMEAAVENFKKLHSELSQTSIEVQTDKRGRPKIIVEDTGQGKKLSMNFCTKAKLERVLREQLGFSKVKAVEAANALTTKLSDQQLGYYLSGSRQLEQMAYYEKDIKFENENVLTDRFSFAKMQFQEEDTPKLTITDEREHFVVLSANTRDRAEIEKSIRQHLKVEDTETVKAIMTKAERLGFVEEPKQVQFKEFLIERETQSAFTVRGGSTVVRLDLSDKETAKKQLMDSFGMTAVKADKIIDKAQKQTVVNNLLKKAKEKAVNTATTLRNKKIERGSRK